MYYSSAINTGSTSLCSTKPAFFYGKENDVWHWVHGYTNWPHNDSFYTGNVSRECTINILSRQILSALFPNNVLSKLAHRYLNPNFQNHNARHRCCIITTFILQSNLRILLAIGQFKQDFPTNIIYLCSLICPPILAFHRLPIVTPLFNIYL